MKEAMKQLVDLMKPLIDKVCAMLDSEEEKSKRSEERDAARHEERSSRREREFHEDRNGLIAKLNDQISDLEDLGNYQATVLEGGRRSRLFDDDEKPKKPVVDEDFEFIVKSQKELIEKTKQELVEHFGGRESA